MRDALLLLFVIVALAGALRFPFAGVLLWAWFSLMTPHQLAYGVYGLQLNLIVAAVTLVALGAHGWFGRFRFDMSTVLIVAFAGLLLISQLFSLDPKNSGQYVDRFLKILLFAVLCVQTANTKLRLHALVWMLVVSIGYFGVKGALFTIVTLGRYHVFGPPNTVLEDNNQLGIALASILPLILYLRGQSTVAAARFALVAGFGLTVLCILGTQSRGAFVALLVYCGYFFLRSKRKLALAAGLGVVLATGVAFMPAAWIERMQTIGAADQDASFLGRVNSWIINTKLAVAHPLTGAGLRNAYEPEIAKTVAPKLAAEARAAHSIYFEILGGAGFLALGVYLGLFALAFFQTGALSAREPPGSASVKAPWITEFAKAAQISLAVFCVGGASVSMEMWDGYWIVIALVAAARRLAADAPASDSVIARAPAARLTWRAAARGLRSRA